MNQMKSHRILLSDCGGLVLDYLEQMPCDLLRIAALCPLAVTAVRGSYYGV
jgi:hypothetical protein